jgi:DNA-binding MarR family transcriptional regulator
MSADREWEFPQNGSGGRDGSPLLLALRELQVEMERGAGAFARELGLSANELAALDAVASAPPGRSIGPADLARRLGITTAAATRLVDRMADSGHLQRHPHPGDRRRLTLRHTPAAEQAIGAALGRLLGGLARVEAALSDDERAVVLRFLHDVTGVWREVGGPDRSCANR